MSLNTARTGFLPLSSLIFLIAHSTAVAAVVFSESFGTVATTTSIAAHELANGFDNDAFTFSGSGDIRATSASSGYTGASALANAFLTSNSSAYITISGISTTGHSVGSVGITFGAYKSSTASDMTTLHLDCSTDGTNWTTVPIPMQSTGTGTAAWRLISIPSTDIPISPALSLRWMNTDSTTQFRIDDVVLTALPEPSTAITSALGLAGLLLRRRR